MTETTYKPTESELEILGVLWEKKKATVREVHEELASVKDSGYTTTLKLMQIMFDKGMVVRDESAKSHVYKPVISREKTQQQFVNKIIHTLFSGSRTDLVLQALGGHTTSAEELQKIQDLITELKTKK